MAIEIKDEIKLGDVFTAVWGYEQRNIDYYEVVKVNPKSVEIRGIEKRVWRIPGTVEHGYCAPVIGCYRGKKVLRRMPQRLENGVLCININSFKAALPHEFTVDSNGDRIYKAEYWTGGR